MAFGRDASAWAIVLAGCLAFTTELGAQETPPPAQTAAQIIDLPLDEWKDGEITPTDASEGGRRFDEYRLQITSGDIVRIDMEAVVTRTGTSILDSVLTVSDDEPQRRPLPTQNDREDETRNAQFYYQATRDITLIVRAGGTPALGGESAVALAARGVHGPYRLRATRLARAASQPPTQPLPGDAVGDMLGESSGLVVAWGRAFRQNVYRFSGTNGDRARIEMTSTAFPVRLQLVTPAGIVIGTSTGGTDPTARLAVVLGGGPGDYSIRAQGPIDASGHFALELKLRPQPVIPPPERIAIGERERDRLDPETSAAGTRSPRFAGSTYFYRDYALELRKDEVVTIRLTSTDFDPVLEVGGMTVFGFAPFMANDDAEEGDAPLNSRLVVRSPARGTALVRVRSLGAATGAYELRVERGDTSPPAELPDE